MKIDSYLLVLLIPLFPLAQISSKKTGVVDNSKIKTERNYTTPSQQLTLKTAFHITEQARAAATALGKNVTIAVLDASGQIIILTRGD